ncbi:MAG: signal peptidase I [Candidatus Saccharimonadales bacterium]
MKFRKKGLQPVDQRYKQRKSFFLNVLLFLGIILFLNTFVVRSYAVEGASMVPSLQNGDRLIVNKVPRTWAKLMSDNYIPGRGDIIVFNQGGIPGSTKEKQLIKRVIGLPGERVTIKNGFVTIYNNDYPDGFDPDISAGYQTRLSSLADPIDVTLKDSQLYVLGDNRTNSEDSRYFGPVHSDKIVGKLSFRLLPLGEAKRF